MSKSVFVLDIKGDAVKLQPVSVNLRTKHRDRVTSRNVKKLHPSRQLGNENRDQSILGGNCVLVHQSECGSLGYA
jgi:hypothetical protein